MKLKGLAKNTVGVHEDCYRLEIDALLDLHSQPDSKVDELESQIAEIIEALNPPTLSIKRWPCIGSYHRFGTASASI